MNDLGSIASDIVTYSFPDDTGRFPVNYVSGWLKTHIGDLNSLTHEDFYIDSTGAIGPSGLLLEEKSIFMTLYEIDYYQRSARETLRGLTWGSTSFADSITMVREGDSSIQKVSKVSISKSFSDLARDAQDRLDNLIFQYNSTKCSPNSLAGEDGAEFRAGLDYFHPRQGIE
jgi:hypothetical protein